MSQLSDASEERTRRKDDSFLRKIAVGVASAVVIQTLFSIYFAGRLSNQTENNTKAIEIFAERLKSQDATLVTLEKVRTLVDIISADKAKSELKFDAIIAEQQRLAIMLAQISLAQGQSKNKLSF